MPTTEPGPPDPARLPSDLAAPADGGVGRGGRRWRSLALFTIGIALLAAAFWALATQRDTLSQAWSAARSAPLWAIAAVILLPILNVLIVAASFRLLMVRFGRISFTEMSALIASAWLLNNLPFRPGMVGRIAYHKTVNNIPIRNSLRVTIEILACTAVAIALIVAAVVLGAILNTGSLLLMLLLPPAVLALLSVFLFLRDRSSPTPRGLWRWTAAIALRSADVLIWTLRYAVVFFVLGRPIHLEGAAALSVVGQVAMAAPVSFGLREWVIGATASALPPQFWPHPNPATAAVPSATGAPGTSLLSQLAPGLLADLVNRAAELACAIPLGSLAALWLYRRWRAAAMNPDGSKSL